MTYLLSLVVAVHSSLVVVVALPTATLLVQRQAQAAVPLVVLVVEVLLEVALPQILVQVVVVAMVTAATAPVAA
jgi:hypothetical protein